MKKIQCELCGSNELVKEGDYFVCKYCGTKYDLEQAKKLIIEGPVDVSGSTIKVDNTTKLDNLYQLARRAKAENNSENGEKYYSQILIEDPNSWEANFYSVYYRAQQCRIIDIANAAASLANCLPTTISLIKKSDMSDKEKASAIIEIVQHVIDIGGNFFLVAYKNYMDTDSDIRSKFTEDMKTRCFYSAQISKDCGDLLYDQFNELSEEAVGYINKSATQCYELYVSQMNRLAPYFDRTKVSEQLIPLVERIKKYNPSYEEPKQSGGCYVATCVYGSYDCPEVWVLRRFRDYSLAKSWYGRLFIRTYYTVSPTIVKLFGDTDWFKNMWKPALDRMVQKLIEEGCSDEPYQDMDW